MEVEIVFPLGIHPLRDASLGLWSSAGLQGWAVLVSCSGSDIEGGGGMSSLGATAPEKGDAGILAEHFLY